MKQVIKHRDGGLLNMIRRTDPDDNKISYVTKNQVKAQLRAEGVKNGGINSKARSVAAQKNLRADKVNKQVEASLKKTNELTSKSFENYIVKEKDNGN